MVGVVVYIYETPGIMAQIVNVFNELDSVCDKTLDDNDAFDA